MIENTYTVENHPGAFVFSLLDYPNLFIYGIIFLISIFLSETFKERFSVMLFIAFFFLYPYGENWFYSALGEHRKPESYYIFSAIWEYYVLVFLYMINGNIRWAYPIYFMQSLAIILNLTSFFYWEPYAKAIYYWYDILNRVFIESTILALISKDNKKGILFVCFLMIVIPYAFNILL